VNGPIRVEYTELGQLLKHRVKGNPKKHDEELIRESFIAHGMADPVMLDDGSKLLGEGHGRLTVLDKMRRAGEAAPKYIVTKAGRWYVPTVRGVRFKDEKQLRRYVLVHNRATERGGWEDQAVVPFLQQLGDDRFSATGFAAKDEQAFLKRIGQASSDNVGKLKSSFAIVVECTSEKQQIKLLDRFEREGLKCRALI
jgi:hypothetical protein